MQFKSDENLPVEVKEILATAGHDTMTVHDQKMVGTPDSFVAAVCREECRSLLTLDRSGKWPPNSRIIATASQACSTSLACQQRPSSAGRLIGLITADVTVPGESGRSNGALKVHGTLNRAKRNPRAAPVRKRTTHTPQLTVRSAKCEVRSEK